MNATEIIEQHADDLRVKVTTRFTPEEAKEYHADIETAVQKQRDGDFHMADIILHTIGQALNKVVND